MAREEAIEILKGYKLRFEQSCSNQLEEDIKAFDMAIEALQELPKRRKEAKRWRRKALKEKPVVRCKECKHRYGYECPMYHEEWFTIDEGDDCYDDDFRVIDKTQDDGFCYCGERNES